MSSRALCGSKSFFTKVAGGAYISYDPLVQCLAPRLSRPMATETSLPQSETISIEAQVETPDTKLSILPRRAPPAHPDVLTTVYKFPSMEPSHFEYYKANKLYLPLRRDILHRAIIYEGDATRQGTASTKWRGDVHGSGRKLRPQKGTGMARVGDKKSPIRRGGGRAFGPHPRDFSTGLPRKIYDLAWRTALSYRYRRGQLIVLQGRLELENDPKWVRKMMNWNHLGDDGGSLIVMKEPREELVKAFQTARAHGTIKSEKDVDVKDLLKSGRVLIEQKSLDYLLRTHSSDLKMKAPKAKY